MNPEQDESWRSLQRLFVQALVEKRGVHRNEIRNFDSFWSEWSALAQSHLKLCYVDQNDQLHELTTTGINLWRPYLKRCGPQRFAWVQRVAQYSGRLTVNMMYRIKIRPHSQQAAPSPAAAAVGGADDLHLYAGDDSPADEVEDSDDDLPDLEEDEDGEAMDVEGEDEDEDEDGAEEKDDLEDVEDLPDLHWPAAGAASLPPRFSLSQRPPGANTAFSQSLHHLSSQAHVDLSLGQDYQVESDPYHAYTHVLYEKYYIQIPVGEVPVFVGSELCHLRGALAYPGDYSTYLASVGCLFWVGTPKAFPYDRKYAFNTLIPKPPKPDQPQLVEVRSEHWAASKRFLTNVTLYAKLDLKLTTKRATPHFSLAFPYEKKLNVSLGCMALALGWKPQQFSAVVQSLLPPRLQGQTWQPLLYFLQTELEGCTTQRQALYYIVKRMSKYPVFKDRPRDALSYMAFMIRMGVFPELNSTEIRSAEGTTRPADYHVESLRKGYRLAQIAVHLILSLPQVQQEQSDEMRMEFSRQDPLDSRLNRCMSPGYELLTLVRKFFTSDLTRAAQAVMKQRLDLQAPLDPHTLFDPKHFDVCGCVRKGVWDPNKTKDGGVRNKTHAVTCDTNNFCMHAHTQKVVKRAVEKTRTVQKRLPHPSEYGELDVTATPDGDKCGVNRFKSTTSRLSPWSNPHQHKQRLLGFIRQARRTQPSLSWIELGLRPRLQAPEEYVVLDNFGGVVGWTRTPRVLYEVLVGARRRGQLRYYVSFQVDELLRTFHLKTDANRLLQPWLRLDPPALEDLERLRPYLALAQDPLEWLISWGVVEYLDAGEKLLPWLHLADTPDQAATSTRFTHVDPYPLGNYTLTSVAPSLDKLVQHRTTYNRSMISGTIALRPQTDPYVKKALSLCYGQVPLVSDETSDALNIEVREPPGVNLLVAVICDSHAFEDNVVLNQRTLDFGVGLRTETKTYTLHVGQHDHVGVPPPGTVNRAEDEQYAHLGPLGVPAQGAALSAGQCLIGCYQTISGKRTLEKSVFLPTHRSIQHKTFTVTKSCSLQTQGLVEVTVTSVYGLEVGDKVYWGIGQKGTLGEIRPDCEMPFDVNTGLRPDLIVSLFAAKRQTPGQWYNMAVGLARAADPASFHRARTNFVTQREHREQLATLQSVLLKAGLNGRERAVFRNAQTGERMHDTIFVGMANVRISKHDSSSKSRSRDRHGPVNKITRQAVAGRATTGGLKTSELVTHTYHSLGVAETMRHRFELSDPHTMIWCYRCARPATAELCNVCYRSDRLGRKPGCFGGRLWGAEVEAVGLVHTLDVEPVPENDPVRAHDPEWVQAYVRRARAQSQPPRVTAPGSAAATGPAGTPARG